MQLTHYTEPTDTLLSYALITAPSPLQVSPQSGPPSIGNLNFVVSCPISVGQVTVTQITFNLPVGDPSLPESTDLTETAKGISPSVSSSGKDQWQFGPGAVDGSFVLKPCSGQSGIIDSQGLSVTFDNIQIGPIVGTALVTIVEVAAADTTPAQTGTCSIGVPKFPYGFYAGNFAADVPMIQNGATVTLSWVGSAQASYTLLWAQQSEDVSKVNQWTSPALTDTTAFILEVTAQEAGQTVTLRFSLTVIVANPNITATTLNVLQTSTLQGTVKIGTQPSPAGLTVSGPTVAAAVNASSLNVSGASTVNALTAKGGLQTTDLTATGKTTLANTAVAGNLALGQWTISVDSSGNLNFSNGSATFQLGANGTLSSGNLLLNGRQVICDQSPISVYSTNRNAYLNGTDHFGGNCRGFTAASYWMAAGYPPDGDSNLTIHFGNPF